ncbi:hypothetical protein [Tengunoibacter tsumagoiensis]|uniref:Uncharacterized protein n=1 Tax=Tengunoibacter tsumagoiensis TaxID=2014871 RepID=A0A402AAC5_9CHLR|nr:hypothetical protein [Tengunoibacter tsumagoiensis]GCE15871.1 hypothetical protein KTT_57300 [Tengunoibacter tsumagoiensis]
MESDTWLDRYTFEKYVLDVAISTLEHGGVTSKVDTYQFLPPIDAWGFPKYPGKTVVLQPDSDIAAALKLFIHKNSVHLHESDAWLGTWVNPTTGCCYLDITVICTRLEDAIQDAIERSKKERRNIEALYNFKHNRTVYLNQAVTYRKDHE